MSKRELAIALILVLGLFTTSMTMALGADLIFQVDRSEDDAFKSEIGNLFTATPLIALKDPGADMFSYFMFRNITIYSSRIINNATLSVYTVSNQDVDLAGLATIYGLEMEGLEIDDRVSSTTANVVWNVSQVRGLEQWHNVTVTSIVQELINRYNWNYGDNLAFEILAIPGETRHAVAYDYGRPTFTAKLYISYGIGPPVPPGLPEGSTYNSSWNGYDIWNIPPYGQVTSVLSAMAWDDSGFVYPFQGKTAYVNTTDKFYIFGVKGDVIGYHFRNRINTIWSEFIPLYTHIAGGDIFTDYFVDRFGKLHVGWVWSYTHDAYYMKFDLHADGSATNYTDRQMVDDSQTFYGPVVVAADSAGYPYMAYDRKDVPDNYGAWVAWSTLNNGTWTHQVNSPQTVETDLGVNPPNDDWFACELVPMGNRRMNLIVSAPNPPGEVYTCSKRNQNSGAVWTGEAEFNAGDRQEPITMRYAISGSSVMNDSLVNGDGWTVRNDATSTNDLWEYAGLDWVRRDDAWCGNYIMASIAIEQTGDYLTLGYSKPDNNYTLFRMIYKNGTYSPLTDLRTFDAVSDIKTWELVTHQNPQRRAGLNKTIVSYAWRDDADIRFYHDWFYIEDGPDETSNDEDYTVTDENGTIIFTGDTLDDVIDWLEGVDPDPEDPEPSGWEDTPPEFSRFSIRRYLLFIGYFCVWGPIWFFCWRRPSGYYICGGALIMLIGFGLLLSVQHV